MADVSEQPRISWCRIWRRRWLWLALTWATCAPGWAAVGVRTATQSAAATSLLLSLVLLAGAAIGGLAAVLVARRDPAFDSIAELERAFRQPVLGSVAEMSAGPRAGLDRRFAAACLGLITLFTGLLAWPALGSLAGR